jgi:uncharacterized protein DUF3175
MEPNQSGIAGKAKGHFLMCGGPSAELLTLVPAPEFPKLQGGTRRLYARWRRKPEDFDMAQARRSATSRRRTRPTTKKAGKRARKTPSSERWSQRVTRQSDALDLERGVFTLQDPKRIAASLKRSAEHSSRRKAGAYRSALSMLTFYINRAGKALPRAQRARLNRAKLELKRQFGRE